MTHLLFVQRYQAIGLLFSNQSATFTADFFNISRKTVHLKSKRTVSELWFGWTQKMDTPRIVFHFG